MNLEFNIYIYSFDCTVMQSSKTPGRTKEFERTGLRTYPPILNSFEFGIQMIG